MAEPEQAGTQRALQRVAAALVRRWQALNERCLVRWRLSARQLLLLLVFGASGVVISSSLFVSLQSAQRRALQVEMGSAAQARLKLLRTTALRGLEALHGIAAYLEGDERPSREAFARFVRGPLERLPEVQALEWIPRVTFDQRAGYELAARAEGLPNFRFSEMSAEGVLQTASARAEYFPVYYAEPAAPNLAAFGFDLSSQPSRREALERTRRTGEASATGPVRLAQEREEGQLGFLVYVPVYGGGTATERSLRGFALAVFRVKGLIEPSFGALGASGLYARVRDRAAPERALFESPGFEAVGRGWPSERRHVEQLEVAGREWEIELVPGAAFVARHTDLGLYLYPGGVVLLTLLVAAYALRGMRHTLEVERRVDERTRELVREVATRRQAEAARALSETRYRSIFENSVAGIFQTTPEGSYLAANPALARIYGYESPEAFMHSVRDIGRQLYVDPHRRDEFKRALAAHASVSDFVSEVYREDGSRIWISENAVAVKDVEGALLYYEGGVRDVTERVRAEELLRQSHERLEERVAQRTRELNDINQQLSAEVLVRKQAEEDAAAARQAQSRFLASVSHEIRTPLNAVIGYSQILERQLRPRGVEREALRTIVQSSHHLLVLVEEVIDLAKIESGHIELSRGDFNLGALVSDLSFMFRHRCERKGLRLRVEGLGASPLWVHGDEGKLRQVLINLLGNAIKFTEHGEVRLRVVPEGDDSFRFEVIDTGIGIPAGDQGRIFQDFYRGARAAATEGAGLGLAICRRLVGLMGGTLELNSSVGWGSDFYFSLVLGPPLAVGASELRADRPRMRLSAETPRRALVVDDLPVNRDILCHMLRAVGCEALAVAGGAEALSELEGFAPDIVFLDVLMVPLDGVQTARALRETRAGAKLKIVAYSASALESDRSSYRSLGFDDFLPKPFRLERVNDCLVRLTAARFVAEGAAAPETDESSAPEPRSLPAELLQQIREGAELYQVTRLRAAFERLGALGSRERELAERLQRLASAYDMSGLLALVAELEAGGERAA
jgi:PAS domain S-box-containing protein